MLKAESGREGVEGVEGVCYLASICAYQQIIMFACSQMSGGMWGSIDR